VCPLQSVGSGCAVMDDVTSRGWFASECLVEERSMDVAEEIKTSAVFRHTLSSDWSSFRGGILEPLPWKKLRK